MTRIPLKALAFFVPCALWAQSPGVFDPEGAQVFSYFPHFADGGAASQKWITSFTFVNPNYADSAITTLYLFGNDGSPLALNLNGGTGSEFKFTVPPQGSVTLTSTGQSSAVLLTGWAMAVSSSPLQSVVQFRDLTNGVPQQGVSALATPPSLMFRSPATSNTGLAVANPYDSNVTVSINVLDPLGATKGTYNLTLGPTAHQSFTLNQILPALGNSFRGSVVISGATPASYFIAWALSADGGVLSSYPVAGLKLPPAQDERIWRIFQKIANAANDGHLLVHWPTLVIETNDHGLGINSYACGWVNSLCTAQDVGSVHIFLNMAELLSDSDGELAFIIAHELGHVIQGTRGQVYNTTSIEWDADQYGFRLSLIAGYDPFGGMGALGKFTTLNGTLLAPNFDGGATSDSHGSLTQRLAGVLSTLDGICADPSMQSFCTTYKSVFHPDLPSSVPLERKGSTPKVVPASGIGNGF